MTFPAYRLWHPETYKDVAGALSLRNGARCSERLKGQEFAGKSLLHKEVKYLEMFCLVGLVTRFIVFMKKNYKKLI